MSTTINLIDLYKLKYTLLHVGDQSDTSPYKDNFKYLYVATFNKTDSC